MKTDSDYLLNQYSIVRGLLKDLINTDNLDEVNFLEADLLLRFKYMCKLKKKIVKGDKDK